MREIRTSMFCILTAVMVALAGTGIAYGHWESTVYMNGLATSGSFGVTVTDEGVASSSPLITASSVLIGNAVYDTISGAYPGVVVNGSLVFNNNGAVPAALSSWTWATQGAELHLGNNTFGSADEAWTDVTGDFNTAGSAIWNNTTGYLNGIPTSTEQWLVQWWWTDSTGATIPIFNGTLLPGQTLHLNYNVTFLEGFEMNEAWMFNITATFVAMYPSTTPNVIPVTPNLFL